MTGREIIIFILENQLEDKSVFDSCFESMDETAVRLGVGIATVDTLFSLGQIRGVVIGENTYILKGSVPVIHKEE